MTRISDAVIFVTDLQGWSVTMPRKRQEPPRGSMIHVRLDKKTHHELKVYAVSSGGTIQSVVSDLIRKKLAETSRNEQPSRRKGGRA